MPKTRHHGLEVSKPFFLLFLLALLLGILYFASYMKKYGEREMRRMNLIAQAPDITNEVDFASETGEYDPTAKVARFMDQVIEVPKEEKDEPRVVLGETTAKKRIEVDLSKQRLYAFEDDKKVFDFLISSGKWGRTPTGTFHIWSKYRFTKMSGGNPALNTYYYLPNVPYVMFFSNAEVAGSRGFSLHGTYWHDNFGHPMSHGCVNMKTEEVEHLYYWATPTLPEGKKSGSATRDNPGTEIVIYGEEPSH